MKERCKDVVGRRVRVLKRIESCAGVVYYPGDTSLEVVSTWCGVFDLAPRLAGKINWDYGISKVPRSFFETLD